MRSYREEVPRRAARPGFGQALEPALEIEGYTLPVELNMLYHLALEIEGPGAVVEIGSYLGRSTVVLGRAVADGGREPVIAVDPHTSALGYEGEEPRATDREFLRNVERAGVADHVRLMHTTSVEAAAGWSGEPVRLLFVDGWHSYDAVTEDVRAWGPYLTPTAWIVFDDVNHPGLRPAIRDLQRAGDVPADRLFVGKMLACGPATPPVFVPSPPGAATIARLGDRAIDFAFRYA
ncbi:MAG: class I SAM-dependent methyltransferase [Actinomycetota bacterium]|nr:class I SAM-dependent methyltransferase [Actinomycetota bacterium]